MKSEHSKVLNKIDGIARSYYENGGLKLSVPFKHGVVEGQARSFSPDGSLESIDDFKGGNWLGAHKTSGK